MVQQSSVTLEAKERGRLAWMALMLTPGMGALRIKKVMERVGVAERVLEASLTELEGLGMPAKSAQFVADGRARAIAEDELLRVTQAGGCVVTPEEELYPDRLREIYDPPAVLWVRGSVELLSSPGIAVVGTRQPSPYGAGMAELLARDLAHRRLTILSGMARGVDTAARTRVRWMPEARRWRFGGPELTWFIQKRTRSWRRVLWRGVERL